MDSRLTYRLLGGEIIEEERMETERRIQMAAVMGRRGVEDMVGHEVEEVVAAGEEGGEEEGEVEEVVVRPEVRPGKEHRNRTLRSEGRRRIRGVERIIIGGIRGLRRWLGVGLVHKLLLPLG